MNPSDRTVIKLTMRQWISFHPYSDGVILILSNSYDSKLSVACCGIVDVVYWHLSTAYIDQFIKVDGKTVIDPRPTIPELIDLIRIHYPDDFDWLLWHPEILEGRYDD